MMKHAVAIEYYYYIKVIILFNFVTIKTSSKRYYHGSIIVNKMKLPAWSIVAFTIM